MKRNGFTMIELVFVIVILGILAAIAVPRLTQSKDDAQKVAKVADTRTCIDDVTADYLVTDGHAVNTYISCTKAIAAGVTVEIVGNDLKIADSGASALDGLHKIK